MQHENALDADVEADLADRKGGVQSSAVMLDDDAAADLHAELVALEDLVVDRDGVADPEIWQILAQAAVLEGGNFGEGRSGHDGVRVEGAALCTRNEGRQAPRCSRS